MPGYAHTKSITFSPTPGTKLDATDFGMDKAYSFLYLRISNISTGTLSIKFQESEDYVEITDPFEIKDNPSFKEIYFQSDQGGDQTVDVIASFAYTSSAYI